MKNLLLLSFSFLLLTACSSTYEKADLYGHWQNENWDFVFNEDGTCKIGKQSQYQGGQWTYRTFGNTLEIAKNGTVFLSGLTVKGIENDELTIEFRPIIGQAKNSQNLQVLKRVK